MTERPLLPFVDTTRGTASFGVRTRPLTPLPAVDGLLAGTAEVDLTPPPGLPKAGYSRNAQDGTGFRTRLRARVLHLRAGTTSIAVVACDLLTGSSVVQHLVADAVADTTDVPLDGLLIGATHTHGGPGGYFGTPFYNRFAANRPGFDPAYTDVLVTRIAAAVEEAVATRAPARLAVGTTVVHGLTRNRSLAPHVRNETVADKRTDRARAYTAVNPDLHVVRVDRRSDDGGHEPLAALVSYSIHGTAVSWHAPDYNADLWAYLTDDLARRVERSTGVRPVVGALQGTHADNTPAVPPGRAGHGEAARIGRALAEAAATLHGELEATLTDDVVLGAGLREVDLDHDPVAARLGLARRPAVGSALIAGAVENQTPVIRHLPPFRPGAPKTWGIDGPHGVKWVIGSRWLQPVVLPRRGFPRLVPVQVLRIGRTALVGLPHELTTETGRRIVAAVRDAAGAGGIDRVVLSSVANDYVGYAATAEEYQLQYYEGGHTLYGPATQAVLATHAAEVAAGVVAAGRLLEVGGERRWELPVRRRLPRPEGRSVARRTVGDPTFVEATAAQPAHWELRWCDASPGDLRWHEPLVHVEAATGDGGWAVATVGGRPVDDSAGALGVTHLGAHEDGHRYAVRWFDPLPAAGRPHRFVVSGAGRPVLASASFG